MKLRKVIAFALAATIACGGLSTQAFASEVGTTSGESRVEDSEASNLFTTTDAEWSYQGATAVKYTNNEYDAEVLVTIPKEILLGDTKQADYQVSVKGHIEHALGVQVKPHDDYADVEGVNFAMSATGENDVMATVTQAEDTWKFEDVTEEGTSKTGTIEAQGLHRGDWTGTLTFDIKMSEEFGIPCDKSDMTDPKHVWEGNNCNICGAVKSE